MPTLQASPERRTVVRTTLDLDKKLIERLMKVTSVKTQTYAIHQAAAELIRRRNRKPFGHPASTGRGPAALRLHRA